MRIFAATRKAQARRATASVEQEAAASPVFLRLRLEGDEVFRQAAAALSK